MVFGKQVLVKKEKKEQEEKKKEQESEEESTEEVEEQESEEEEYLVLKELPVQPIRKYKDPETGVNKNLITVEEALTDMTNQFKKLTGGL